MSDTERHDLPADGTPDPAVAGDAASPLAELTKQRDEYYDLLLRKTAEFDNYRKRIERERREQSDYVAAEVIRDLLPVLDNFERALKADAASADSYRKGIELVHRQMLDALQRRGVAVIDPAGADFDPHQHEAVQRVPAEGRRDGEVVEVFSRGYKLGDRLLRPAMVKVATA